MPGILGEISKSGVLKNFGENKKKNLIVDKIESKNYYLERRTINKFLNDKVFWDEKYIVITEGVILNSLKLIEKYRASDFKSAIIKMYETNGEKFFGEFRGSFSGLFYDKQKDIWLIYTNHIGDKQIFYSKTENGIIFGSEINYLVEYMRNNNIKYTFDKIGAYFLLTYGYMLEDYTLFKEIKKLNAGKYIKIKNDNFEIHTYFEVDNTPDNTLTEEEIIENVDKLFRNAVKLEFEKDKEYGYKHVASLSGGLDSRMTTWVAHELGYLEQLNVTFSQTDYLDETIAKSIARDLKHEWLFKALDNGNYLKNIDEMIEINFGNCLYSGNAHVNNFMNTFNFENYGVYHTGQVGGIIKGYYLNRTQELTYGGEYSKFLMHKISYAVLGEYENEGIFRLKNRQFNGTLQGNLPVQMYSEVISPFLDVDLVNYCLRIPSEYGFDNRIYKKWILKKYPAASKYKWEAINGRITEKTYNILGYSTTLKALPRKAFNKVFHKSSLNTKKHMNPLDYWFNNNNDLKGFILNTYRENIPLLKDEELNKDCQLLFNEGNTIEKTQVLTLLVAYKKYFGDNHED